MALIDYSEKHILREAYRSWIYSKLRQAGWAGLTGSKATATPIYDITETYQFIYHPLHYMKRLYIVHEYGIKYLNKNLFTTYENK